MEKLVQNTPETTPRLELGYSRKNFLLLLTDVKERYEDILHKDELNFIEGFESLSEEAGNLFVRLSLRLGPYFRSDKLSYPEISDIESAIQELHKVGFLEINSEEFDDELLLGVVTVPELKSWVSSKEQLVGKSTKYKKMSRDHLIEWLVERIESLDFDFKTAFYDDFTILGPQHFDFIQRFKLLFFGNLHQEMSEFILEDLGVMKFEKIVITPEARPFKSRSDFDEYFYVSEMASDLYVLSEEEEYELMWKLLREGMKTNFKGQKAARKFLKLMAQYGRVFESLGELNKAIKLYGESGLPPSRERLARIAFKNGQAKRAYNFCEAIKARPLDSTEEDFLNVFMPKVCKELGKPVEKSKRIKHPQWDLSFSKSEGPIELQTLEHLGQSGWNGSSLENSLWKSLFGVIFWDVIWQPIDGVFFNPYQRGPSDLFSSGFRASREKEFEAVLGLFDDEKKLLSHIKDIFVRKFRTANLLVNWHRVTLEDLEQVVVHLGADRIKKIMIQMAKGLGRLGSGFPDLFVFNDDSALLVEVKGPGDQLRPNQRAWLKFFNGNDIPYKVAKVKWKK